MNFRKYYIQIIALFFVAIILGGCGASASNSSTSLPSTGGTGGFNGGGGGIGYGTATLSWTPPTQNTDGSALTNLAGYKIYYGTSSGNYNKTITIKNAGITEYVVENLASGNTYYFVICAYDTSGMTSGLSGEGRKAI